MTYDPFKCPDCKLWWRTATHRCEELQATKKYLASCNKCYLPVDSNYPHVCKANSWMEQYNKKKKGNPHDPKDGSTQWHA